MTGKLYTALALTAGLTFSIAVPARADQEQGQQAAAAAETWLELVDEGKYEESWDQAAELFKRSVPKKEWSRTVAAGREPMGKLISRELSSKKYSTTLPGAPDGEYVVIQFATSFENKKSAVETVTPMKDPDGAWRVSGYFIK